VDPQARDVHEQSGLTEKILAEALASAGPDLPDIDPYTGEPVESDENEEWSEDDDEEPQEIESGEHDADDQTNADLASAALRLLEHATTQRLADQRMSGMERTANRQALQRALHLLTLTRSKAGVDLMARMVAVDPLLTRPYVDYLRALPADGLTTARRVQDTLRLFRGHAPFWTQAWLANALLDPRVALTDDVRAWLQSLMVSRAPAALRVRAPLALAFHREISAKAIGQMLDKLPPMAWPDAVAAMALADGAGKAALEPNAFPEDRLLRWTYELASEHREDPGPLL
jgi:hypothetical protein